MIMYKHSPVHGPGNIVIRSCKSNSHLHHRLQATSTKAKRNMKRSNIGIPIMKHLYHWVKTEVFWSTWNPSVAWWSLMAHWCWEVGQNQSHSSDVISVVLGKLMEAHKLLFICKWGQEEFLLYRLGRRVLQSNQSRNHKPFRACKMSYKHEYLHIAMIRAPDDLQDRKISVVLFAMSP